MSDVGKWMSLGLAGLALAAVASTPLLSEHQANKKTDARIDALEATVKKLSASQRGLDARTFQLEEMRENMQNDLARVLPADARWIELARGGRDQWEFDVGGRVQVQFEGWSETGTFGFQMNSRAGETHGEFRPGMSLTAVDDKGDSQRHYTMALHRVDLDRDGRPFRGLVSVTVTNK